MTFSAFLLVLGRKYNLEKHVAETYNTYYHVAV